MPIPVLSHPFFALCEHPWEDRERAILSLHIFRLEGNIGELSNSFPKNLEII